MTGIRLPKKKGIKIKRPSTPVDMNSRFVGRNHPDTSKEMERKVLSKTGTLKRAIYDFIVENDGATDWDLQKNIRDKHESVSSSRNSLMKQGWVYDSGQRRVLPSGHKAIVWKAVL